VCGRGFSEKGRPELDISEMAPKLNFYYVCTLGGKNSASSSDEEKTHRMENS
jgi:hypothetical protein